MRILISGSTKNPIQYMGESAYEQLSGQLTCYRSRNRIVSPHWAMDNRAFVCFEPRPFRRYLDTCQGIPGCLFVVAPDVIQDAAATLRQFWEWQPIIAGLGYPIALAAQDGLEYLPIPWNAFQALFIGGSTAWKLSMPVAAMAAEAKRRNKWVHMGRVNSRTRLRYAQSIGCDSVDGTTYNIEPIQALRHLPVLQTVQHSLWSFSTC